MDILRLAGTEGFDWIMADIKKKVFTHAQEGESQVISSSELFAGKKEVRIRHGEALYRLLITRQGKLILNK